MRCRAKMARRDRRARRRCGPISRSSAGAAAKFLVRPDGPRIGALAFDGWDTHADEGAASGRLAALLGALDGAIAAVEKEMGASWRETVVAVVTEFGRTARINGTDGTDHGTATIALLAGGALKGGRVIANWPGLKSAQLHEGRDLKPTTDLRAVIKGVLADHLRIQRASAREQGVSRQRLVEADDGIAGVTSRRNVCRSRLKFEFAESTLKIARCERQRPIAATIAELKIS